jgi:hypothetical protein
MKKLVTHYKTNKKNYSRLLKINYSTYLTIGKIIKSICKKIENFFKVSKKAFRLGKIHHNHHPTKQYIHPYY